VIKALARLLRRLLHGSANTPPRAPEQTPERRIDAARERLKQTIAPPEDEPPS
jgi:hypothetical protein